jgi:hypothetical protein
MQTILKISLIFIVVILFLYFVFNYLDLEAVYVNDILNNSTLGVEGFSGSGSDGDSPSDVPKLAGDVETLANKMDDSLQVKKYRKDYEKLIVKADEMFELLKLDALAELKEVKMSDDKRIVAVAEKIQLFEVARKSLESALNYIDTK